MKSKSVLIVGAGPTGLTAAVELARRGIVSRVIDKKESASTQSRAVGINPRTLHLLRESGADVDLISKGVRIQKGIFHIGEDPAFEINLGLAPKPYDFLLALPQDETERILTAKFESYGGEVEYGTSFSGYSTKSEKIEALLDCDGQEATVLADYLFGADGIHSRVRDNAGIGFSGIDLPDKWSIVDFDSASWPHKQEICLFFFEQGKVCLIVPIGENRYRGVCDRPDAISNMPKILQIDNVRRTGEFKISVKQAETYQKGSVFIAGDAAHCHSPVGGRGMNLGMADAAIFAQLLSEGDLNRYTAMRNKIGERTINITERGRKIAMSEFRFKPLLFKTLIPLGLRSVSLQQRIVRFVLDCPES